MPRKRQPPRLYFREDEKVWVIRDGPKTIRTGCGVGDSQGAQEALAEYLNDKFQPVERESNLDRLTVAEVLTAYGRDYAPTVQDPARISWAIEALLPFWGEKTLAEVRGSTCREFIEHRRNSPRRNMTKAKTEARRAKTIGDGTIRRELGVLRAAIGYWHKEHGPLQSVPAVTFPPKPEAKPDWLNRSEMARLLAGALGWYQLSWSDISTRQAHSQWKRDRSAINRHTARFIVVGRYTANRPGATLGLQWMPNIAGGWPDIEGQVLYRKGAGRAASKKRQPMVRLGRAVIAHLRRWKALDERERDRLAAETGHPVVSHLHVVSWKGGQVSDIGKSFATALDYAGLPARYTPHILRHTRVTWWVQAGLSLEEVADAAGMTVQMVEEVYWHQSPHFQKKAAEA